MSVFMTGAELRETRKALKLTQVQFAKLLDMSTVHVTRMERERVSIKKTTELAVKWIAANA